MPVTLLSLLFILAVVGLLMGPGNIAKLGGELGVALREFKRGLEGEESSVTPAEKAPEPPEQASEAEPNP